MLAQFIDPYNHDQRGLETLNEFIAWVVDQKLPITTKLDANKILEMLRWIKVNRANIAEFIDNKAAYLSSLSPRDRDNGVVRDHKGTSVHFNSYTNGSQAAADLMMMVESFENAFKQYSIDQPLALLCLVAKCNFDKDRGCIEARVAEPMKFLAELDSNQGKLAPIDLLQFCQLQYFLGNDRFDYVLAEKFFTLHYDSTVSYDKTERALIRTLVHQAMQDILGYEAPGDTLAEDIALYQADPLRWRTWVLYKLLAPATLVWGGQGYLQCRFSTKDQAEVLKKWLITFDGQYLPDQEKIKVQKEAENLFIVRLSKNQVISINPSKMKLNAFLACVFNDFNSELMLETVKDGSDDFEEYLDFVDNQKFTKLIEKNPLLAQSVVAFRSSEVLLKFINRLKDIDLLDRVAIHDCSMAGLVCSTLKYHGVEIFQKIISLISDKAFKQPEALVGETPFHVSEKNLSIFFERVLFQAAQHFEAKALAHLLGRMNEKIYLKIMNSSIGNDLVAQALANPNQEILPLFIEKNKANKMSLLYRPRNYHKSFLRICAENGKFKDLLLIGEELVFNKEKGSLEYDLCKIKDNDSTLLYIEHKFGMGNVCELFEHIVNKVEENKTYNKPICNAITVPYQKNDSLLNFAVNYFNSDALVKFLQHIELVPPSPNHVIQLDDSAIHQNSAAFQTLVDQVSRYKPINWFSEKVIFNIIKHHDANTFHYFIGKFPGYRFTVTLRNELGWSWFDALFESVFLGNFAVNDFNLILSKISNEDINVLFEARYEIKNPTVFYILSKIDEVTNVEQLALFQIILSRLHDYTWGYREIHAALLSKQQLLEGDISENSLSAASLRTQVKLANGQQFSAYDADLINNIKLHGLDSWKDYYKLLMLLGDPPRVNRRVPEVVPLFMLMQKYQSLRPSEIGGAEMLAILEELYNGTLLIKVFTGWQFNAWPNFLEQLRDPTKRASLRYPIKAHATHKYYHLTGEVREYQRAMRPKSDHLTHAKKQSCTLITPNGFWSPLFQAQHKESVLVGVVMRADPDTAPGSDYRLDRAKIKGMFLYDKGTYAREWVGTLQSVMQYSQYIKGSSFTSIEDFRSAIRDSQRLNEVLAQPSKESLVGIVMGRDDHKHRAIALQYRYDVQQALGITLPIIFYDCEFKTFIPDFTLYDCIRMARTITVSELTLILNTRTYSSRTRARVGILKALCDQKKGSNNSDKITFAEIVETLKALHISYQPDTSEFKSIMSARTLITRTGFLASYVSSNQAKFRRAVVNGDLDRLDDCERIICEIMTQMK